MCCMCMSCTKWQLRNKKEVVKRGCHRDLGSLTGCLVP